MCSTVSPWKTGAASNHCFFNNNLDSNAPAFTQAASLPSRWRSGGLAAAGTAHPTSPASNRSAEQWEPAPEAGDVRHADGAVGTGASFARKLVLLPHPGDEIACAGLLQHSRDPVVVFATDGMTGAECSCPTPRRQQTLREVRRREAKTALILAGIRQVEFLSMSRENMEDLRLYQAVGQLFEAARQIIARYRPTTVLVPAYEGGHPDHDVCSFVGALIRQRLNTLVWEMPLYHKADTGELVYQRFRRMNGTELVYTLGPDALSRRAAMVACYSSRRDFAELEAEDTECYRPQAEYDYSRPPQNGTVNYENWRWPVSPVELCRELAAYARKMLVPPVVPGSQPGVRPATSR